MLSVTENSSGTYTVAAEIQINAPGIRYVTFSAPSREDYVSEIPVSRLNKDSMTSKHAFIPKEGEDTLEVTVKITDYYGTEKSASIIIEFGE